MTTQVSKEFNCAVCKERITAIGFTPVEGSLCCRCSYDDQQSLQQQTRRQRPLEQGRGRVQLYANDDDIALIDSAAEKLGESRSVFMVKAALARTKGELTLFTKEQVAGIHAEVLKVIAKS